MAHLDFENLYQAYKQAADHLVDAIHAELALASPELTQETLPTMEHWDAADFKVQDALHAAKKARDAYKDAVREKNYGF
jgi:hypothetical protein